jgi:hypothetical protein
MLKTTIFDIFRRAFVCRRYVPTNTREVVAEAAAAAAVTGSLQ